MKMTKRAGTVGARVGGRHAFRRKARDRQCRIPCQARKTRPSGANHPPHIHIPGAQPSPPKWARLALPWLRGSFANGVDRRQRPRPGREGGRPPASTSCDAFLASCASGSGIHEFVKACKRGARPCKHGSLFVTSGVKFYSFTGGSKPGGPCGKSERRRGVGSHS